ncbi:DUF4062 domain-containing protein [Microbacterium ulmi]|uniref:DUF4062 domain-containing protein n=1 Tax=Microbacterium ulmi TaxID=179095 RepID=A0A7Y2LXB3_9MICO|nr:DUF4062 domain-containing protein [Microbacterium ulmi]NII71245.1 putative ATPase [Microbacterium ulmi]NNH02550.1 DUF4062 domain-containing protein [Microbacterium ulmi]
MTSQDSAVPVIRTPDQRLRVFVSSTLAELAEERAAVRRAIESLGLAPVMFELGARPHPPQELYRAYLAQSDIFIGLYWQSYGWVGPGMDISGLEDEFRLSGHRPRLLYLKAPAPEREDRLTAMIDELRSEGTDAYRTFRSTRELGRLVRDDLALLLSERFVTSQREQESASSPVVPPSGPALARSLPVASTPLIGRSEDVAAVMGMLARDDVRLVDVTGPGGMGKTRLSIAVGEAVLAEGVKPVWFVPLAAVFDPAELLPRIATAVGAVVEGTRSALDALADEIGQDEGLLILDNFEQIAAAAPQLDELLTRCPRLDVLVTSRVALRLRAEHEYVLGSLDSGAPTADVPPEEASSLPAVRLFLDRASTVRRGIPETRENLSAVREICHRLDGLPLAIELAAARTRLLDPSSLLARLESVLDTLGSGPVDLPERQRTLRATVEWSMDLLDEPQQRLLAQLSVFAGGWSIAAAAAIADADEFDTLDRLDALAGHSLVSVEATHAEPRFRMLAVVRELAAERLTGHARDGAERRHAEHFASVIDTDDVPADLTTPWSESVRRDEENIRLAIEWFFRHDVLRLPHLLRSLWLYWQTSDRLIEGRQWIRQLETIAAGPAWDDRAHAEILFTQAVTGVAVGDDAGAIAAVDQIPAVLGRIDEPALRNALQLATSWSLPIRDDFDGALAAASTAYDGFAAHDDAFVAFAALTVGMLQAAVGRDGEARRFLEEANDLGARFGNLWLTSSARTQCAILDVHAGDLDGVRETLAGVLDELEGPQLGTITACFCLVALADLAAAEGRPADAAEALGTVEALRSRAGLLAWPIARRGEAALRDRVVGHAGAEGLAAARRSAADLRPHDAIAIVRRGIS